MLVKVVLEGISVLVRETRFVRRSAKADRRYRILDRFVFSSF